MVFTPYGVYIYGTVYDVLCKTAGSFFFSRAVSAGHCLESDGLMHKPKPKPLINYIEIL